MNKVMKTNEAPEKIYFAPYGDMRVNHSITDNDIEYVRKDDFIEKAVEWLKRYVLNNDTIDIFEMEEQFKNYMKGE